MSSGVDPYARREPAAAAVAPGAPPWTSLIELHGGVLISSLGEVSEREPAAGRFVAVAEVGDGVTAPVARIDAAQAVLLLVLHGEERASAAEAAAGLELLEARETPLYAIKHGWVAGPPGQPGCVEVDADLVGAVLAAELAGALEWERDLDFGYEVAVPPPGLDGDRALALRPRLLYTSHGRVYEHAALVAALKRARAEQLESRCTLPDSVVAATGWPPEPTEGSWKEEG